MTARHVRRRGEDTQARDAEPGHRHAPGVGVAALAALALLSVLVATGVTDGLDDRVRELFRPAGQWGGLQVRVDTVVEGLRPPVCVVLLALATLAATVLRRSWWPVVSVAVTGGATIALAGALKFGVGRVDTHGDLGTLGGSYPSGHVATVLVTAGCLALLARERPGPLVWALVALLGGVMAWALLVQTAHWFTDVLGGVLVAIIALSVAVFLPFTGRLSGALSEPPPAE